MKKKLFLLLLIFLSIRIYPQTYKLSFAGTGAGTTVDSVYVENLTKSTSLTMLGKDALHLGANSIIDLKLIAGNYELYPNPMKNYAELFFDVRQASDVHIIIFDYCGKMLMDICNKLVQGTHHYEITGLKTGAYLISIRGKDIEYNVRLISNNNFPANLDIKYLGIKNPESNFIVHKSINSIIDMVFTPGDNFRFIGFYSKYIDTVEIIPTGDQKITFNFIGTPALITNFPSNITNTSTKIGGNITSSGGTSVTSRGVCWSTSSNPTITDSILASGTGTGNFAVTVSSLSPNTLYHFRAYAANSLGLSYGNELLVKTYTGTITDIDGNIYNTVTIGTQLWMASNLSVKHYNNGDSIKKITGKTDWSDLTTSAYCDYNNDTNNSLIFGKLYNWYSVSNPKKLCPTGWHIPSNNEWATLTDYLGGDYIAPGKLKEAGSAHWKAPNTNADNSSGFTALPAGDRNDWGTFLELNNVGAWWSTTGYDQWSSYIRAVAYDNSAINKNPYYFEFGLSIRCLKD